MEGSQYKLVLPSKSPSLSYEVEFGLKNFKCFSRKQIFMYLLRPIYGHKWPVGISTGQMACWDLKLNY